MALARQPMAVMMSLHNLFIYAIRYGYPYIIPFIVQEYGLSEAQRATLLSAFTPGYICAQIPGGLLAGRVGGKAVLTGIAYVMSAALALLPAAAARSATLAAACLGIVGLAQAPMRPAQVVMTYNWVPHGPSRAYYMMIISLGSALAKLAAAVVVPALCASRGGWRSAALALAGSFGAFNLLWQLLATELPDDADAKEQQKDDKEEQEEKEEEVKAGEGEGQERVPTIREMYFAPVFQVIIWSHTMKDLIDVHTFGLWGPTFLHLRHGVPLGRVGAFLLFPSLCSIFGKVFQAPFESRLTSRGVALVRIRKMSTAIACATQLIFAVLFVAAPNAVLATAAYCLQTLGGTFHYSGLEQSYVDVGGKDGARIKGFLNTSLWLLAYLLSMGFVRLREATGSWAAIFLSAPLLQLVTTAGYCRWATALDYRSYRAAASAQQKAE